MSYQDVARAAGPGADARGFAMGNGVRNVESSLLRLANNISKLKRQVDILGTAKDTVDHRHAISDTNNTIQDMAKSIKEMLTAAHDVGASTPEQQQKQKKLVQDFAALLQDYKATQKIAQTREASCLPRPNPARAPAAAAMSSRQQPELDLEQQALLQEQQAQQQAQVALQSEMAHNEALIEERDAGIREIVGQIREVNEIMQDLAVLVNDQGVQVRTIDEQITTTAERTREGARELLKAERSQRSQRNKCLWLSLILAVVVSLILILAFA